MNNEQQQEKAPTGNLQHCKACDGKGWGLFINPPGDWTHSGKCAGCNGKGLVPSEMPDAKA